VPVWAKLASGWNHDLWRILAVSVGPPQALGYALALASGLPAQGCIGADATESIDLDRSGDRKSSAEGTDNRTLLPWPTSEGSLWSS
jgi:hypothetical protein